MVVEKRHKYIKIFLLCYIIRDLQESFNIIWQSHISRQTPFSHFDLPPPPAFFLAKLFRPPRFHQFYKSPTYPTPHPLYEGCGFKESNRTSMIHHFAKIVKGFWLFVQKAPSQMFNCVPNMPLNRLKLGFGKSL